MQKIRVLYMGKDKDSVISGFEYLLDLHVNPDSPIELYGVVASKGGKLWERAAKLRNSLPYLKVLENSTLYSNSEQIVDKIDLCISFLHPNLIKEPYISTPRIGAINFHPAPLPRYRGVACYSRAILNEDRKYGVTAHYVDSTIDTGDIIAVRKFNIDPKSETALSLENKSMDLLLKLFMKTISALSENGDLPRKTQDSDEETFLTKIRDIDVLRKITDKDTEEDIDRKSRAFWFPPFGGASIEINGKSYTVVSDRLLEILKK